MAERRIHSAEIVVENNKMVKRIPGNFITWCKNLGMRAATGPLTALASFPGSGNTWCRYLIQQATGKISDTISNL